MASTPWVAQGSRTTRNCLALAGFAQPSRLTEPVPWVLLLLLCLGCTPCPFLLTEFGFLMKNQFPLLSSLAVLPPLGGWRRPCP